MKQQTIKHQSDNGVRQSRRRLRAFVSMGEDFLFLFKYLKVHHNNDKIITNWSGRVLPDLKNLTKLMALKTDERSSHKWPAKVLSSMASLHKNDFSLEKYQHVPILNPPSWLQEPLFYIGLKLVTIFELPPKIWLQKGPISPNNGKKSPIMLRKS